MINWRELEEKVQSLEREAALVGRAERYQLEREEELELTAQPLRRRVANALIQLGVKIDPQAAEELNSVPVEAA